MKRAELEHVIRAAGSIANANRITIIGSQAILGAFPNPPAELTISQEADLYPTDDPAKADLIDGSIGEKSPFHETFGYYAHGVGPETAVLPSKWMERIVTIQNENTNNIAGLCLGPADLAVSKLAAGREKDILFVSAMLRHGLISAKEIEELFTELTIPHVELLQTRLRRASAEIHPL